MGQKVSGSIATPLSFDPVSFPGTKMKIGKVNKAGTPIRSGPRKGELRDEASVIIKGRPTIDGVAKNWATCPLVGVFASIEQDNPGACFVEKTFKVKADGTFSGELLDECILGNDEGRLYAGMKA